MREYGRQMMVAAAAAAIALGAAPAGADVKAGVDAWQSGNHGAAVREWRGLAERGDPDAQFNLGQAYRLGKGVPQDIKIAQSWFQKSAQQGHEQAQANLGLLLFQGGNRAAAMPWIRKAADRGDARAQYILGTAMFNGDLAARDWPRAYALMTVAAGKGLSVAANSLTEMDKYVPLPERQRGIALARQIERGVAMASLAPVAKPPRVAGAAVTAARAPTPAPAPRAAAPAPKPAPAKVEVAKAPAAKPPVAKAPAAKPPVATAAAAPGGWRVQLGAYSSADNARSHWAVVSRKVAGLGGLQPMFQQAGKFTRLQAGPLGGKAAADKVCAAAKAAGQACFTVKP